MILKATLLFLLVMLALGVFGKWRAPRLPQSGRAEPPTQIARKCPVCDAYAIGATGCGRADCPRGGADRTG